MLPRILAFAIPIFVYAALVLVVYGLYRERLKFDRWMLVLAAGGFLVSLAVRPNEHLLFFDEDIYINIASNLSHAPVAQLTLAGGAGDIHASTYYKEPAGFSALLGLIFLVTGTRELIAFLFARVLYGLAVAAVYMLGREIAGTRAQAVVAAIVFAATPACFGYSASTGTDLAAALFAALFIWGIVAGSPILAAGSLAMASQVRLEMIALAPLMLFASRIPAKWKIAGAALLSAEVLHVAWVLSLAPELARAERVAAAFSMKYAAANLWANLKYVFDPRLFPAGVVVLALAALVKREGSRKWLIGWIASLSCVYLLFYAGSFEMNPRYSIQVTIPLVVLAVSLTPRKTVLALLLAGTAVAGLRPWQLPLYVQTLAIDHRTALEFAGKMETSDLIVTGEPEIFMNNGRQAINAVYAMEQPGRLREQFGKFKRIFYYGGVRTNEVGNQQWEADRRVKSEFELHLVEARVYSGMRIAIYELLQPLHGVARQTGAFHRECKRCELRTGRGEGQEPIGRSRRVLQRGSKEFGREHGCLRFRSKRQILGGQSLAGSAAQDDVCGGGSRSGVHDGEPDVLSGHGIAGPRNDELFHVRRTGGNADARIQHGADRVIESRSHGHRACRGNRAPVDEKARRRLFRFNDEDAVCRQARPSHGSHKRSGRAGGVGPGVASGRCRTVRIVEVAIDGDCRCAGVDDLDKGLVTVTRHDLRDHFRGANRRRSARPGGRRAASG